MVSRWRDRAAFTAYMRSEDHKISHDRIPPELQIKLERLELAADVVDEHLANDDVAERLRNAAVSVRAR